MNNVQINYGGKSNTSNPDSTKQKKYKKEVFINFGSNKSNNIVISSSENGTVKANTYSVNPGEEVTLTIEPKEGYKLDSIVVTDNKGNQIEVNGDYTFIMPDADYIKIKPIFTETQKYNLSLDFGDGTYNSYQEVEELTIVNVSLSTGEGKRISRYHVYTELDNKEVEHNDNYSFVMPSDNAIIKLSINDDVQYDISKGTSYNGDISVSNQAYVGEDVTVTPEPQENYKFDSIKVYVDSEDKYDFVSYGDETMETVYGEGVVRLTNEVYGDKKVFYNEVEVEENSVEGFVGNKYYIVSDADTKDIPSQLYTLENDELTGTGIYVIPSAHKEFLAEYTDTTFIMPDKSVTLESYFVEKSKYNVLLDNIENGSVDVVDTAYEGNEVSISATPDTGYIIDTITVKDSNNEEIEVNDNIFVMPADNVIVKVTFKEDPDYVPEPEPEPTKYSILTITHAQRTGEEELVEDAGGIITTDKNEAQIGEEVTFTIEPYYDDENGHYDLFSLLINGEEVDINTRSYVVPEKPEDVADEEYAILINAIFVELTPHYIYIGTNDVTDEDTLKAVGTPYYSKDSIDPTMEFTTVSSSYINIICPNYMELVSIIDDDGYDSDFFVSEDINISGYNVYDTTQLDGHNTYNFRFLEEG